MKLRRRWKVFWNLAVIFTIIVVVRRWDPPFDDSDMRVTRVEVPADQNAFWDYQRIGDLLAYGPHPKNESLARMLADASQGWPVIHALAASNRHVIAAMESVKDKPHCQGPEIESTSEGGLAPVSSRLALAKMLEISAASLLQQGRLDEASRVAVTGIHFAHHMCLENETLVAHLVGLAAQNIAMANVRRLTADPAVTDVQLARLAQTLLERPLAEESLANALRGEYRYMCEHLESAERKQTLVLDTLDTGFNSNDKPSRGLKRVLNMLGMWAGYLPNQTRRLMHGFIEPHLAGAARPANHPSFRAYQEGVDNMESDQGSPRRWLRPNIIGEAAVSPHIAGTAANSWKLTRNTTDLTRTFVALRRYQLRHGLYPQNLNELCPEFLDEVPVDRFDGAPIRYDATTVTIYSAWPLDEKKRPITGSWLFDKNPVVNPTEPNASSVFVLPGVRVVENASSEENSKTKN